MTTTSPPSPPSLWSNRSFAVWLISTAQSKFGMALSSIALSFLVLQETGSIGGLSLTLALTLAPNILMPLAGAYIDRIGVKMPLVLGDAARGVLQLTLAGAALLLGNLPTELIYAVALLNGLVGAFAGPAGSSAVPLLVDGEELPRANGLMESFGQGAWLAGYAAGGLLVAAFGPAWALALDGLTYLVAAVAVGALVQFRTQQAAKAQQVAQQAAQTAEAEAAGQSKPSLLDDLRGGLDILRGNNTLAIIPPLAFLINAAFAPTIALTPALMEKLGQGAGGYSAFLMLETAGSIVMGAAFARWGKSLSPRLTVLVGFVMSAVSLAIMAWIGTYPALLAGGALLGLSVVLVNTPLVSLMGQLVPPTHLGRVFSILGMTATLGMPLALILMTPYADTAPPAIFFVIAGVGMLLAGALWWLGTHGHTFAAPAAEDISQSSAEEAASQQA